MRRFWYGLFSATVFLMACGGPDLASDRAPATGAKDGPTVGASGSTAGDGDTAVADGVRGGSTGNATPVNGSAAAAANTTTPGELSMAGDTPLLGGTLMPGDAPSEAVTLDQTANPIYDQLTNYQRWLSKSATGADRLTADRTLADNMITWQMPHGGFYKNAVTVYAAPWDGVAERSGWHGANGVDLGTIDNDATVTELMFLADVYQRSGDTKYRDSARSALGFLLGMQYSSGGFPQVFPARTGVTYSNYVTFNDDAMVRVMILLEQAAKLTPPLDQDLFTPEQRDRLPGAFAKGIEYILAAQIEQAGVKTVWCAQHDPTTYAPQGARSYELPSKSGQESVGIVELLMTQPQTPEVQAAVQAAIAWYESSAVKVPDTVYVSRAADSTDDTYSPIQPKPGATMWYRFYDLDQDVGFFSGRLATDNPPGVGKKYDIMEIEPERRYGYQWAGAYGSRLFAYTDSVGY
jgi:PelA/Pel-15E family pectate lyase